MSALAAPQPLDVSSTPRVPFARLVKVEWRKMLDTRSGRWLMIISAGLLALVFALIVLISAGTDSTLSANDWLNFMTIPLSMLVPVMAITTVTTEWSQRTAMVTFALESSRLRVVLAKLLAVLVLGAAKILLAVVLGVLGTVLSSSLVGVDADWDVTASTLTFALLTQVLYLFMGFGFGLLLLSSPAALALYYVYVWILEGGVILPGIMYVLYFTMDWAQDVLPWISMRLAMLPFQLSDGDTQDLQSELSMTLDTGALGIARVVTSVMIWVGLPLLLGTWRLLRAEVK